MEPSIPRSASSTDEVGAASGRTARAQEGARIPDSEARYHAMAEAAEDAIMLICLDETIQYINPAGARLVGLTPQDIIGRAYVEFFRPAGPAHEQSHVQRVFATGERFTNEFAAPMAGGSRWMSATLTPLIAPAGTVTGVMATVRDISARRQAEEALRASEARFRTVVTHAQPIIFMIDRDGMFLLSEGKMLAALGLKPGDVVGKSAFSIYQDHPAILHGLRTALAGAHCEDTIDVGGMIFDIFYTPHRDAEGVVIGLIGMAVDITERMRAQNALAAERASLAERVEQRTAELSRANIELAFAVRAKDEFLAMMSHELRTPLNTILGSAELLREQIHGPLNVKQHHDLGAVAEAGQHLLALINDILDLAKIEAGREAIELEIVVVEDLCRAAMRMVAQVAVQRQVKISAQIDPLVVTMSADGRRIKQILVNLLANAVKFTPAGGEVGLEVRGAPAQQTLTFSVWDTGIGIASEDQQRLFKPFVQINSSLSRQHGGTGLGLALVLQLARLHGGSVAVESAPGQGSRFSVTLPWVAPTAGHAVDLAPSSAGAGHTIGAECQAAADARSGPVPLILLADDNEANIDMLLDYMLIAGYQVAVARNGAEAVARAAELQPALILMDIQMPVLDGLEAIRRIRAGGLTATPIIALTALAMRGDRERCMAAGANAYISKPISLRTLLATITDALAAPPA